MKYILLLYVVRTLWLLYHNFMTCSAAFLYVSLHLHIGIFNLKLKFNITVDMYSFCFFF